MCRLQGAHEVWWLARQLVTVTVFTSIANRVFQSQIGDKRTGGVTAMARVAIVAKGMATGHHCGSPAFRMV
jgi:hypothetical protein